MDGRKYTGQLVFGLDIGTRSVVGTVGYRSGNKFIVAAQRVREHETRAMLDGQIHDIQRVGETIREVKAELERAVGRKLSEVCIAAAGRVLRTVTTHVEYPFAGDKEIGQEDIYALVAAGIEKAYQEFLDGQEGEMKFYCVGHSVVRYYLNGYPMGNLEGHKARTVGVDLIATFLPAASYHENCTDRFIPVQLPDLIRCLLRHLINDRRCNFLYFFAADGLG